MASFRKAINDKCKDCIYDPSNGGTWREQVESCTVTLCPLYILRAKPSKAVETANLPAKQEL